MFAFTHVLLLCYKELFSVEVSSFIWDFSGWFHPLQSCGIFLRSDFVSLGNVFL